MSVTKLENVILPGGNATERWDLEIARGNVVRQPTAAASAPSSILLRPALCHPHIHLDKPYILTCNHAPDDSHPDYSDLAPKSGSFTEALKNTSRAKTRYTEADLYLRGSQLLADSHKHGVTSLRAFVEVDHVTELKAIEVAIRLKHDFAHLLEMQICVFAQDPLFSTDHGENNLALLRHALQKHPDAIDALGSTPYVESSRVASLQNISHAILTAISCGLHLDFHLDYNLNDPAGMAQQPLIYDVVQQLDKCDWNRSNPGKTIVIGHCTQVTQLSQSYLADLAGRIKASNLPIHFVGLPTSDLFMMGRPQQPDSESARPHSRPRGTLQVPSLIRDYGLDACLGVNNVGNAFTPYGTGDPLQMASFGVGIYHAGTVEDAEVLYECVSSRARNAIGLADDGAGLLVQNRKDTELPERLMVPARQRLSIKDVVWDPPETSLRSIVR